MFSLQGGQQRIRWTCSMPQTSYTGGGYFHIGGSSFSCDTEQTTGTYSTSGDSLLYLAAGSQYFFSVNATTNNTWSVVLDELRAGAPATTTTTTKPPTTTTTTTPPGPPGTTYPCKAGYRNSNDELMTFVSTQLSQSADRACFDWARQWAIDNPAWRYVWYYSYSKPYNGQLVRWEETLYTWEQSCNCS
jgi:hypothetical protein